MIYSNFEELFDTINKNIKDSWRSEPMPEHTNCSHYPKDRASSELLHKYNELKKVCTVLEQENLNLNKMVTNATRPVIQDTAVTDAVRFTLRKVIEILEMLLKRI